MRRGLHFITLVSLVALVGLLPARAEPRDGFHLEQRLPGSTLAFASMEDLGAWQQRIEATALGKMMADPEMQAFMAPITGAVEQMMEGGMAEVPPLVMDLTAAGIRTIIWATGYRPDLSWLHFPVLDRKGRIRHDGGVVEAPGMYLMGIQFLRRRKSALIDGAGDDARDLSDHLVSYLDGGNTYIGQV